MEPGSYPRVNSAMMNSGQYNETIVSLVGKFVNGSNGMNNQQQHDLESMTFYFQTADQGIVQIEATDGFNVDPTTINYTNGPVYEIIGQVIDNRLVGFIARMLSVDMDLSVYNRVIQIQRNPKYAHYFESAGQNNRMVTN